MPFYIIFLKQFEKKKSNHCPFIIVICIYEQYKSVDLLYRSVAFHLFHSIPSNLHTVHNICLYTAQKSTWYGNMLLETFPQVPLSAVT